MYNRLPPIQPLVTVNPLTGRKIQVGNTVFKRLTAGSGALYDYDPSIGILVPKIFTPLALPSDEKRSLADANLRRIPFRKGIRIYKNPENGSLAHAQGRRPEMEDEAVIAKLDDIVLQGVFDGHGGSKVSKFLAERLPRSLLQKVADSPYIHTNSSRFDASKVADVIRSSIVQLDEQLCNDPTTEQICYHQGSTAVILIRKGPHLWVANTGDSRAVAWIKETGDILLETVDHKPHSADEKKRIQNMGGFVQLFKDTDGKDFGRVNGDLATSKAIGDSRLKTNPLTDKISSTFAPLIATPDVYYINLSGAADQGSTIVTVLACDGLFDVMTNDVLVELSKNKPIEKLAPYLVQEALKRKTDDNVTVLASEYIV